jgi:ketosteroid isomerase-like protein
MTPTETVLRFLLAINEHDPEKLASLMTEDHLFVDSLGHPIRGRAKMLEAWRLYYEFCPDYRVSHRELFESADKVAVFGSAGGTISDHGRLSPHDQWNVSAAWLALASNGLVREWRVYADNKPVYDILARRGLKSTEA